MTPEHQGLEALIHGLERQRPLLGDAVVDAAVAPMRARLAALAAGAASPIEPPPPAPTPGQTLRLVTTLFVDIVGSTRLGRSLDPEDTHEIVDGAMAACTRVVADHGGRVLQYAGDGLLAVFGGDAAQEDDAERAVRAGLAILAEAAPVVQGKGAVASLAFRVGAHTGRVLLGGGVDAEGSIRGATVNLAARMEQSAPAGRLRISHDTYRLVRGVFDVEPQAPLELKGFDEPVVSYLVQRAKPRAFRVATRGIEGVETRMVGRGAELARLQAGFDEVFATQRLVGRLVIADAGVGKSRLLYEFENWAEGRPETFIVYRGRAVPQTQSQPYGLLRDVLAWRLQIADADTMAEARDKLERALSDLFVTEDGADAAEAQVHLLGHLIGLDFSSSRHLRAILGDGLQIRNRAFDAAARMFRRVAARRAAPIVLLLEDLHWADEGSLDFLDHLAEADADVPILIVAMARPVLFERREPRLGSGSESRIDLLPLDPATSGELVAELLQKLPVLPSDLRELIAGTADGNPFFMEELVKMLVDEGAIGAGPERWEWLPHKVSAKHVPQTLVGVVQARLDRLRPEERLALQQASVVGSTFWDRALVAIDPPAIDALPALTRRELVAPHPEGLFDDAREYAFQHQILHQVTYDTVLKRLRRQYHAKAAAWLATQTGARANDFLAMTAEHFREADDPRQACEYFTRAAESARSRHAHETTFGFVASALALLDAEWPEAASLRWRLLDVRERTFEVQARRAEQLADIEALMAIAEELDDDRRRSDAAWRRCDHGFRTGDFAATTRFARVAMAFGEKAGDDTLRLRALQRLAGGTALAGDRAGGQALALDGLAQTRALGLRPVEGLMLSSLNLIASLRDELGTTWNRDALLVDRELGNMRFEARDHCNIGISLMYLGDHEQAALSLAEGLRLTRAVGDRHAELYPLTALATLARRQGDNDLAWRHSHAAVALSTALRSPDLEMEAFMSLGHSELARGRDEAAADAYSQAHRLASQVNQAIARDACAGLAAAALAGGDVPAAMAALEPVVRLVQEGGSLEGSEAPRLILLTCHQVLARAGDPRAHEFLAAAHANVQERCERVASAGFPASDFIENIPEHREIVAAWLRARPGDGSGGGAPGPRLNPPSAAPRP